MIGVIIVVVAMTMLVMVRVMDCDPCGISSACTSASTSWRRCFGLNLFPHTSHTFSPRRAARRALRRRLWYHDRHESPQKDCERPPFDSGFPHTTHHCAPARVPGSSSSLKVASPMLRRYASRAPLVNALA